MSTDRSRSWIITLPADDYSDADVMNIIAPYFFKAQREKGEEGGYEHYQIYIEHIQPIRFETLKKKMPRGHFEPRRGSRKQAYDYVTKTETRIGEPFGFGEIDTSVEESGSRSDLNSLRELVFAGVPVSEILLTEPSAARFMKYLDRLALEHNGRKYSQSDREVSVSYIWGKSGVGKTRAVYAEHGYADVYRVTDYTHPFDLYEGQRVLVLDEFRSQLQMSLMLNLLDRYPMLLPARYNNRWAAYTKVILLSNIPFTALYPNVQVEEPETFRAFERRFQTITELTAPDQPLVSGSTTDAPLSLI